MERLDKFITSQTTLSRREAVKSIRRGEVTADGQVLSDPSAKIDPAAVRIVLRGQAVAYQRYLYVLLNKPAGILCVSRDPHARTVVDLLPEVWRQRGLFPAGRLDKDTTGMVILTDDGEFAHRMLAPNKHVAKTYLATLDAPADETVVAAFAAGLTLADGTVCRPAGCVPSPDSTALVTLHEGKYHQIKRMFAACGRHVTALRRLSMGGLSLDPLLSEGESRLLTEKEIRTIFEPKV